MSPTSKKPPTQHSPAAGAARTSAAAIQVDELRLRGDPWLEDIALRYAAGKTDEILAEIRQRTQDPASATDPAPWRMLFDLYEALGRREAYEELALAFAVRFERSPPAWSVATRSVTGAPAEPAVHAFARADGIEPAGLRRCLGEAQNAPYIRLDFTGTNVPGDTDARAMLDCIGRLRKLGKAIEVVGGAAFLVRLRSACASPRGEAGVWLLRLALEELLGDQAGFEETALQYAIRFEMSPPSYSAPKPLPLPQPEPPCDTSARHPGRYRSRRDRWHTTHPRQIERPDAPVRRLADTNPPLPCRCAIRHDRWRRCYPSRTARRDDPVEPPAGTS